MPKDFFQIMKDRRSAKAGFLPGDALAVDDLKRIVDAGRLAAIKRFLRRDLLREAGDKVRPGVLIRENCVRYAFGHMSAAPVPRAASRHPRATTADYQVARRVSDPVFLFGQEVQT